MVNFTVFCLFVLHILLMENQPNKQNVQVIDTSKAVWLPSIFFSSWSLSTLPASIDPCLMFSFTHIAMIMDEVPARCGKISYNSAANIMVWSYIGLIASESFQLRIRNNKILRDYFNASQKIKAIREWRKAFFFF